jgi:hypothetical protein
MYFKDMIFIIFLQLAQSKTHSGTTIDLSASPQQLQSREHGVETFGNNQYCTIKLMFALNRINEN